MASIPSEADIKSLWSWFESIAPRLGQDFDNAPLLEELDRRVTKLGKLAWELGPGTKTENALTLTPDGAAEWLPVTQRIVAMAPTIPDWEFHPAKPAKQWDLQFSLEGSNGSNVDVDARQWRYVLLRRSDDKFDIVLEEKNLAEVGEEDRYTAAVVLLDGLLGEARRLLLLGHIDPVVELSGNQALKANSVTVLSNHLESLV